MKFQILIILVLVIGISGCTSSDFEGTLRYQEQGINQCEAYYLEIDETKYKLETSENIDDLVGKNVTVKGYLEERDYALIKCAFMKIITVEEIHLK